VSACWLRGLQSCSVLAQQQPQLLAVSHSQCAAECLQASGVVAYKVLCVAQAVQRRETVL
jgi:hypothetical protein